MTKPQLGPRAIHAYNRLNRELAAFNYVLRISKPSGVASPNTLFTLNGLFVLANRLFRRHRDLPRFINLGLDDGMSQADLAVQVARLTTACLAFEERYAHLTESGRALDARTRQLTLPRP